MKRAFFLSLSLTIWLTLENGMAQKPDLTGVEIVTHQVRDNIYMLEATKDVAGNMAVSIGADGILLVDSQFSELADSIRAALLRFHDAPIKYIINSHYHDDHSDGKVWRHSEVVVQRSPGLSSHMEFDPASGWLYIADTGNERIIKMDPNSGTVTGNLNPYGETLAGYYNMSGTDWDVVADTGLIKPTGLDIYDGKLLISDYSNGDIIVYDITQDHSYVMGLMKELKHNSSYTIKSEILEKIKNSFCSHSVSQEEVINTIDKLYEESNIVIDPHTAVGLKSSRKCSSVYDLYVTLSTAHPAKFKDTVSNIVKNESYIPAKINDILNLEEKMIILENDMLSVKHFITKNI